MLDVFKGLSGGKTQKQAEEFQALIVTAKEERSALNAMLAQIALRSTRLSQVGKTLDQVDQKTTVTSGKIADVDARVGDEVAAVRGQIKNLLATAQATEEKIAVIEDRRKTVDEVQAKANLIANLLEDVSLNLETLGEQKSVIDHLSEKLARVDFTMQEAQNTLKTLKHERELAERMEQSIKQLRTRTAKADIPRKSQTA